MTAEHKERFIADQLLRLKQLGLSDQALAREEALLRSGLEQGSLLASLFEKFAHGG